MGAGVDFMKIPHGVDLWKLLHMEVALLSDCTAVQGCDGTVITTHHILTLEGSRRRNQGNVTHKPRLSNVQAASQNRRG